MATINISLPDLPYAVEEALNRLRINVKFCGKKYEKNPGGQLCAE